MHAAAVALEIRDRLIRGTARATSVSFGPFDVTPAAVATLLGKCTACRDTGLVCENHPDLPWGGVSDATDACECGAGMPCRACCDPIPQDGTHSIAEAFTPRKYR
jgi:hypothetical protein